MWITKRAFAMNKSFPVRPFTIVNTQYYDGTKIQEEYFRTKIDNLMKNMKNMEEERFFDYERNEAKYDPKTGKIELIKLNLKPEKKIIKNFDDMKKEKQKLNEELKLTTEDVESATPEELADRYQELYERTEEGYLMSKADFYAETYDNMRVD